ncbi:hypothetical protein MMPV_010160 [Pyropia vietnamensis]
MIPLKCRSRGIYRRPAFKGTLLLLRKQNFEIDAALKLRLGEAPTPSKAVVDSGAGPSVVRADVLPPGWEEYVNLGPRRTRVCDASGQLLRVRGEIPLTIYVDGYPMRHEFLVVRGLSVPLILGWDFQRAHVETIFPKTETILWDNGSTTKAKRSWVGTQSPPPKVKAKPNPQPDAVRLFRRATLPPRTKTAVQVRSDSQGVTLVQEEPGVLTRKGVHLHNAVLKWTPGEPEYIYLLNLGEQAVVLPKGLKVGWAEPCGGPILELGSAELPEGQISKATVAEAEIHEGAGCGLDGRENTAKEPTEPPRAKPTPDVAWSSTPSSLRGEIEALLSQYEDLWAGQLGRVEVVV